tara:strand:- start:302 stop:655 length:354 start_codon:yes stop_codon:yes gene_type:complete
MNRMYLFALGACAIAILIVANLPGFSIPGNPSDKLQHVAAFAVLAAFAAGALPREPLWRLWLGLSVFAAGIEAVQYLMALGREADWVDFLASVAGATAALSFIFLIRRAKSALADAR